MFTNWVFKDITTFFIYWNLTSSVLQEDPTSTSFSVDRVEASHLGTLIQYWPPYDYSIRFEGTPTECFAQRGYYFIDIEYVPENVVCESVTTLSLRFSVEAVPCSWCGPNPISPIEWKLSNGTMLVFSNMAFIACAIVLMIQSFRHSRFVAREESISIRRSKKIFSFCASLWIWSWEITEYLMTALISSLYHQCDTPSLHKCVSKFEALRFIDVYISFILFTTAVTPHLPLNWFRNVYKSFMTMLTLSMCLYYPESESMIISLAVINGVIFAAFNLIRFSRLRAFKEWSTWAIFPAIGFLVSAVMMKFAAPLIIETPDADDEYAHKHSLWHIFAALASMFMHLFMDPTRDMYMLTSTKTNTSSSSSPERKEINDNSNNNTIEISVSP